MAGTQFHAVNPRAHPTSEITHFWLPAHKSAQSIEQICATFNFAVPSSHRPPHRVNVERQGKGSVVKGFNVVRGKIISYDN